MSQDEMISMKLTGFGKPLEQVREPIPTPKGTQVLLKVISAGLCHSGSISPHAVPAISATIVP
jgi:D-arabinose 1-dehydrogenase-like Zn-dependent alcohol dehydrogenase